MAREQRKSLGQKRILGPKMTLEQQQEVQEGAPVRDDAFELASSSKERCLSSQRVDRESQRTDQNLVSEANE